MLNMYDPDPVIELVAGFTVQPAGDEVAKLTCPVKPFNAFTVRVVWTWVAAFVVSVFGDAERLKSGVGGAAKLVVSGLPIPVAKS